MLRCPEQDQFEQHLRADVQLSVYLYYGQDRNRSTSFLASQDVVLTTYNVLSADYAVSSSECFDSLPKGPRFAYMHCRARRQGLQNYPT